jgi:hypothetical protein
MRIAVLPYKLLAILLIFHVGVLALWRPAKVSALSGGTVIAVVNEFRSQNGLPPLGYNGALTNSATMKANDMFAKNYWSHYSPEGNGPAYFIGAAGYGYISAGENLAKGFSYERSIVNAWMGSDGHRANVLNPNFQHMGVGVVAGTLSGVSTTAVVAHFGQATVAPAPAPAPIPAPQPTPVPQPISTPPMPKSAAPQPSTTTSKPVTEETTPKPATLTEAQDVEVVMPAQDAQASNTPKASEQSINSSIYRQVLYSIPKFWFQELTANQPPFVKQKQN